MTPAPGEVVRVVIADDHPMFRYGLSAALDDVERVVIVGEATDGDHLLRLVRAHDPDVVLTDLAMPTLDGVTAVDRLVAAGDRPACIVLTMSEQDDSVLGALRAGARGYLLKGADRDEIVRAIETVAAGGTVFGDRVGRRVTELAARRDQQAPRPFPELTTRETEILGLVATGLDNRSIGESLHLAEKTVRNNVASILTKLHLRDRAAAVATARDHGLGA
ncbi:response regulator transcription factor [Cellulomonas sp.]|uniref:response regulator n=1 Tax=Cellulomonas sp. TaxID=40001 RepID=UPI0025C27343|nr:response regulator transcription factor [Cellulomonas sp.]